MHLPQNRIIGLDDDDGRVRLVGNTTPIIPIAKWTRTVAREYLYLRFMSTIDPTSKHPRYTRRMVPGKSESIVHTRGLPVFLIATSPSARDISRWMSWMAPPGVASDNDGLLGLPVGAALIEGGVDSYVKRLGQLLVLNWRLDTEKFHRAADSAEYWPKVEVPGVPVESLKL